MKIGRATGGVSAVGKPGTANQFQRRELVAVPALRRAHPSAFSRESWSGTGQCRGGILQDLRLARSRTGGPKFGHLATTNLLHSKQDSSGTQRAVSGNMWLTDGS